jgi:hypothetical protein
MTHHKSGLGTPRPNIDKSTIHSDGDYAWQNAQYTESPNSRSVLKRISDLRKSLRRFWPSGRKPRRRKRVNDGLLRGWSVSAFDHKGTVACATMESIPCSHLRRIEHGFLVVLVAICANVMRRFGTACLFSNSVSCVSGPYVGQFVARFFSLPLFKTSNLFFKLAYFFNQRRAFLIGIKNARLGVENNALQFDDLRLNNRSVPHILHRLRDIHRRLNGGNST